jgi:anti-anti-sigma factor
MIETRTASNAMILEVPSAINDDTMKETLDTLLEQGNTTVLLNLKQLTFVDSCGLGVLVNAFKQVKAGQGKLGLFGVQPYVQKLVELTKLNRVLSIYDTEEAALEAFNN